MSIVVTGVGSVSAAGGDATTQWANLQAGSRNWTFDAATGLAVYPIADLPHRPAIEDFCRSRSTDRSSLLALYAAEQAVEQAGWADREFAILLGCSRGPTLAWEENFAEFAATGRTQARSSPVTTLGSIGFALADYFGTSSLTSSLSVTCSSGMHALLHGVALLRAGMVDRVLVGGTEASLTPFTLRQMQALRVYATPTVGTTYACRPLDIPATGMAIGEGAAFLALERSEGNREGWQIDVGFAREQARSATGITARGLSLQQAMQQALGAHRSVDVVVAHAPGTARGDAAERAAVREVFNREETMPVLTSFKWATGHTFGASGPLALVTAVEMLRHGVCVTLPYGVRREVDLLSSVLVNATGFGGNAVSVLVTSF